MYFHIGPPTWPTAELNLGLHPLTKQLQALASSRPKKPHNIPVALSYIVTPLQWPAWEQTLSNHPDRIFATLIVQGVKEGFRVGFDYNHFLRVKSCNRNMASVYDHPSVVHEYLANECAHGRVFGPFDTLPVPSLRLSKFGVIPKRNQENKWRLIVDLSSPTDQSINDGIDAYNCSMSYVTVDDIAASVLALGRGALLAKSDIKHAYRQIPVHPQDRILLGLQWQGQFYVDATLPFGLRSAPLIFSAVADAVEWVMRTSGVKHIFHYIDDFVIVGPPNSDGCSFGCARLDRRARTSVFL